MKKAVSLLPFLLFLTLFITLNTIYFDAAANIKDGFPIFAAFMAIIGSFFTFQKNTSLQEKIEIFIQGAAQPLIIHMCFIFVMSTVFTNILNKIGSINAIVDVSLHILSPSLMLPGIFTAASLFSFAIGSSMGTIAALMPIAYTISQQLEIAPALMAGIVVGGAIFGDNLSIISDTTISAVQVTGATMYQKMKYNMQIALPASVLTIIALYLINQNMPLAQETSIITIKSICWIKLIPYLVILGLALYGLDILVVLTIGTIIATAFGLYFYDFNFLESTAFLFNGFYESKAMVEVFILILLLSGLSKIVEHNGGIDYLLDKIKKYATSVKSTKFTIFLLVCAVNITIAINTISILITGPIAKKLAKDKIDAASTATILDVGSCISQGVLPYAPQILLATSMCSISSLSVLPYLYYQYFLLISLLSNFLIS